MSRIPLDDVAPSFEHRRHDVGALDLHYVIGGPEDGDLVVLLHGFPQFWYTWRHQLEPLADAGFRVVAPDLRGYNESDRPSDVESYRMDALLGDVTGLIRSLDRDSGAIVGHDWGGGIAWELAMASPTFVEKLGIINAPHPAAWKREGTSFDQAKRSWYVWFFLLPKLPEMVLSRNDFAFFEGLFRTEPKVGAHFTTLDIERYKAAFRKPGTLTAGLNYYRALVPWFTTRMIRESIPGLTVKRPTDTPIGVPTQVIWGTDDVALVPELASGLEEWVPDVRVERLTGVSHWVQEETPKTTTTILRDFLRG